MLGFAVLAAALGAPAFETALGEPALRVAHAEGVVALRTSTAWVGVDPVSGQVTWRLPRAGSSHCDLGRGVPGTSLLLLGRYVPVAAERTFDVVDGPTGRVVWSQPGGDVLGVYPGDGGAVVVVSPEPGALPVRLEWREADGTVRWADDDALVAPPPLVPVAPDTPCGAWSTDGVAGPAFAGAGVLTRWAPTDGLVLRSAATGAGVWRLVGTDPAPLLPAQGFADLVVDADLVVLPVGARRTGAVAVADGRVVWERRTPPAQHVAVAEGVAVIGGADEVVAVARDTGRRVWRLRWPAPIAAVARGPGASWVLDARGVVTRVTDDGVPGPGVDLAGDALSRVIGVEIRGEVLVARLEAGALALDARTGAVRWRVVGRSPALRCPPPVWVDPAAHVWLGEGPTVHRTALDTGADTSAPIEALCDLAWDASSATLVGARPDGTVVGWRPSRDR